METVEWLPAEPLTIQNALEYEKLFDHIEMCTPMLGVNPDPQEHVVLLYVGIGDRSLWTAYDPGIPSWIEIESGPARSLIAKTSRILDDAISMLQSRYLNSTFAVLERASLRQ